MASIFHPRWKGVYPLVLKQGVNIKQGAKEIIYLFNSLPQLFSFLPPLYARLQTFWIWRPDWQWYENHREACLAQYGTPEIWWKLFNLWRQPFHAIPTTLFTLACLRFNFVLDYQAILICFAYGLIKEIIEFISDKKFSKPHAGRAFEKSFSDVFVYTWSSILVVLMRF